MKKTLIFIISAALFLNACTSRSQAASHPDTIVQTPQASPTLTNQPTSAPQATSQPTAQPSVQHTAQPTGLPTQTVAQQPTAANPAVPGTSQFSANASSGVDDLKLRIGPGFGFSASRLLAKGQALNVLGRSNDSLWLEVRLPDGSGGWVFNSYVISDLAVTDLPVKEASGGAYPAVTPQTVVSITMSISGTAAVVKVNKFPANAAIVAKLGLPGTTPGLLLAKGTTDEAGQATLSFSLPAYWADGTALTQNDLVLLVATLSGSFSQSAAILYIH
jgi:uncharacterized protein YraI